MFSIDRCRDKGEKLRNPSDRTAKLLVDVNLMLKQSHQWLVVRSPNKKPSEIDKIT